MLLAEVPSLSLPPKFACNYLINGTYEIICSRWMNHGMKWMDSLNNLPIRNGFFTVLPFQIFYFATLLTTKQFSLFFFYLWLNCCKIDTNLKKKKRNKNYTNYTTNWTNTKCGSPSDKLRKDYKTSAINAHWMENGNSKRFEKHKLYSFIGLNYYEHLKWIVAVFFNSMWSFFMWKKKHVYRIDWTIINYCGSN